MRPKENTSNKPFRRGVSIGCGSARAEIDFISPDIVSSFVLYEASQVRLEQARELASKRGILDRIEFNLVEDSNLPEISDIDFVFWKAALRHMLDADAAVKWSRDVLTDDSIMVMDEYVGPDKLQWTVTRLDASDRVRAALPERHFHNAHLPRRGHPA